MVGFTVLAFQILKWQSADISVSIVSESDEGNNEVTISVLNTAGSTLLFYENEEMTGKIEYLSDNGWVEYCDVSYTMNNVNAVSHQYGGTFAELEPGENWDVSVPADKVEGMKDGTYRIKMTYITEREYNEYLDNAFENRNDKDESEVADLSQEDDMILENPGFKPIVGIETDNGEKKEEEEFLASAECEVFVKTFEYTAPEDFVQAVSIDDSQIETDNNGRNAVINEMK